MVIFLYEHTKYKGSIFHTKILVFYLEKNLAEVINSITELIFYCLLQCLVYMCT